MKSFITQLALSLGLLASTISAQVTYTNPFVPIAYFDQNPGANTAAQTFTGFTEVQSMEWYIKNPTGGSGTTTFNAYLAEWNTGTNLIVPGSLLSFDTQVVSLGSGAGSFVTFTPGASFSVNPFSTYVAILSYGSGTAGLQVGATLSYVSDFFSSGVGVLFPTTASNSGAFASTLQSGPSNVLTGFDFSMIISATPYLTPVPEPKTAAAGLAGLFVAGLVGRRVWQRRRASAAPLAA